MNLKVGLEALLFAADQPLGLAKLQEVLGDVSRQDLEAAIAALEEEYGTSERAFHLVRVAGGFQLTTKRDHAELVRRLYVGKRRVRLTRAALEALAIIAYKQPTTRPEIDAIRGVSSGGVVETLLERNLVRIAGRAEGVGRPLLYATTSDFLEYLGLNNLKDLPSLSELEALLAEREAEARRAEEEELFELAAPSPDSGFEAVPEDGRMPTATVEQKLQERNLASLHELDEELEQREAELQELSSRIKQAGHSESSDPPATEPTPGSPEGDPAPGTAAHLEATGILDNRSQIPAEPGAVGADATDAPEPMTEDGITDPLGLPAERNERTLEPEARTTTEVEPRST